MMLTPQTQEFVDNWQNNGTKLPGPRSVKHKPIFDEIRECTKHLPEKYTLSQRIYCLKTGIVNPKCPQCGKSSNLSDRLPIREQYCSQSCAAKSPEIQRKIEQTSLERYGVKNPTLTKQSLEKKSRSIKQSWQKRSSGYLHTQTDERLNDRDWLEEQHVTFNKSCPVIAQELNTSLKHVHRKLDQHGITRKRRNSPKCYSQQETEIQQFIHHNYGMTVLRNTRIDSKREVDLYVPEKNLAIEHDGLYWHSFDRKPTKEERTRHQSKKIHCIEKGIDLLQFWEHEWKNNSRICKSMIRNKLNQPHTKLRASELKITQLQQSTANMFFDAHHIQGSCIHHNGVFYGLVEKSGLILAVMSFGKPRFNKDHEWELIRFCVWRDHRIYGAGSKLFRAFVQDYNPKSVISYCNLRYGTGKLYETLGFKLSHITEPSYFYCHNTNCVDTIVTRYQAQKHKLPKLLPNFDSTKTEQENMFMNGYRQCFDSGNLVYIYS